jgi:hypothetical protein
VKGERDDDEKDRSAGGENEEGIKQRYADAA